MRAIAIRRTATLGGPLPQPALPEVSNHGTSQVDVVFTLPQEVARIAFYNQEAVYGMLFRVASETLLTIARDPQRSGRRLASSPSSPDQWKASATNTSRVR